MSLWWIIIFHSKQNNYKRKVCLRNGIYPEHTTGTTFGQKIQKYVWKKVLTTVWELEIINKQSIIVHECMPMHSWNDRWMMWLKSIWRNIIILSLSSSPNTYIYIYIIYIYIYIYYFNFKYFDFTHCNKVPSSASPHFKQNILFLVHRGVEGGTSLCSYVFILEHTEYSSVATSISSNLVIYSTSPYIVVVHYQ